MTTEKMKEVCGNEHCWANHPSFGWNQSHRLIIILTGFPIFAILVPYIVAISRKDMPAFLPFISQAWGYPPMIGMFAVPMIIMAFFGVITVILLHESINHRNIKHNKRLRLTNKLSLFCAFVVFFGFILTSAYPVGYTDLLNKFEWVFTVLFEHTTGATLIFAGAAILSSLWTINCYLLPDTTKQMKYFRVIVSVLMVTVFLIGVKPINNYIAEELGPRGADLEYMKTIKYDLPVVFSTNYIICAVVEWIAGSLAIMSFMPLYYDMKRISFRVVISPKTCFTQADNVSKTGLHISMS